MRTKLIIIIVQKQEYISPGSAFASNIDTDTIKGFEKLIKTFEPNMDSTKR